MNDLSGIRAFGQMLNAARKPKVWTKRELFTVTTGELDAMPMEDQKSWGQAITAHWQGRDIDQDQREYQRDRDNERNQDFTR